jgi:hypothetical protein
VETALENMGRINLTSGKRWEIGQGDGILLDRVA